MALQRGPHLAALCWPFSDDNLRIYPRAQNFPDFLLIRRLPKPCTGGILFFHPDNFPKFIKGWQGFIFLKAFLLRVSCDGGGYLKRCVGLIKVTQLWNAQKCGR